ncbi:MAG: rhomboid family intramembrane serine protease [Gemmatimonadetes bacterium]|nr:rhomboid family intramembrane serine protease [Gemmatimonadota bacterium]
MMIPLKDEHPSGQVPVLMIGILLSNVGIFVYAWLLGDIGSHVFNARYGAIPFEIMHGVDAISPTPIPIYFTLLSSMFMHGGILHLGGNMLYLWIFGNNIEAALGRARFLFFYLFCGVIATLSHVISEPESTIPMVGASGAIAGILGGYLAAFPGTRILVLVFYFILRVPALIVLGGWFVIQLLNASSASGTGDVAWFAHIAGFVVGYILMRQWKNKIPVKRVYEQWEY